MKDPDYGRYFYICLRGQVKGEHGVRCHVMPCTFTTSSGIEVYESVKRLVKLKSSQGHKDGPAISGVDGKLLNRQALDDALHEVLLELFHKDKTLFPGKIKKEEEIKTSYQIFRTLRRTSDTVALDEKVDPTDIDIVNRWEGVEAARGRRPNRTMKQHYADILLLLKPFLRYTYAQ